MGRVSTIPTRLLYMLCSVVDILEGGDVTQRDCDKPERGLCDPQEVQQVHVQDPASGSVLFTFGSDLKGFFQPK